jgi:DNA-binding LytR/AlgR family response regulator
VTAPGTGDAGDQAGLHVLAVDDEPPALADLAWMLGRDPRVASVRTAGDGAAALSLLQQHTFDAVFLDIRMPGVGGLDLAGVLGRFSQPPQVVFVTAYDDFAVEAFDLRAVDYLLKPVNPARLAEAVRRVLNDGPAAPAAPVDDEKVAVERAGVTRYVRRSEVRFVEAHGDYARLHTDSESHLVRVPLSAMEERWKDAGFVRTHRRYLVAVASIAEYRSEGGRSSVVLSGGVQLPVARRHAREVRERLLDVAAEPLPPVEPPGSRG